MQPSEKAAQPLERNAPAVKITASLPAGLFVEIERCRGAIGLSPYVQIGMYRFLKDGGLEITAAERETVALLTLLERLVLDMGPDRAREAMEQLLEQPLLAGAGGGGAE